MLNQLSIKNFKNIAKQDFELKSLTILTGLNSTGKSSVIYSILLLSRYFSRKNQSEIKLYVEDFSNFREIRNKYTNAKLLTIKASNEQGSFSLSMGDERTNFSPKKGHAEFNFEEQLYHVAANRIGQESLAYLSGERKIGKHGEYIVGCFHKNKDNPLLTQELIKFKESETLDCQVNGWLKYILDLPVELKTESVDAATVKVTFNVDGNEGINPFNVGAGNSYLAKILIIGLLCNKGNMLLIENPEIHLHPKAQSRLGEFFAWLAQNGVQVIVETHSEHLINKIRYQVYKKILNSNNVTIYYKKSIKENFINININEKGHFINENREKIQFPSGFFDSTLDELLEIG